MHEHLLKTNLIMVAENGDIVFVVKERNILGNELFI